MRCFSMKHFGKVFWIWKMSLPGAQKYKLWRKKKKEKSHGRRIEGANWVGEAVEWGSGVGRGDMGEGWEWEQQEMRGIYL